MNNHFLAALLAGFCGGLQRLSSGLGVLALLLGLGLTTYHPSAHAQVPLNNITQVAAGGSHTCALTTGGGVKCWGNNFSGQLGDGTTTQRLTAVDVSGLTSGVSAIAAGGFHTCALTTGGGVKCWGSHQNGQLGIGGRNYGLPGDVLTTNINLIFFNGFESTP